jgi:hypothetical protein
MIINKFFKENSNKIWILKLNFKFYYEKFTVYEHFIRIYGTYPAPEPGQKKLFCRTTGSATLVVTHVFRTVTGTYL